MKNILILLLFVSLNGFSHSGGTDQNGGHHDRKNGGYHYHHGEGPHQHLNGICELSNKYSVSNPINSNKEKNNWSELLFVGALGLGIGYFLRKRKENQKE